MKIAVLSASRHKNCALKNVARGYGTVFTVSNSPFAKLLEHGVRGISFQDPDITFDRKRAR